MQGTRSPFIPHKFGMFSRPEWGGNKPAQGGAPPWVSMFDSSDRPARALQQSQALYCPFRATCSFCFLFPGGHSFLQFGGIRLPWASMFQPVGLVLQSCMREFAAKYLRAIKGFVAWSIALAPLAISSRITCPAPAFRR